jgi:hypothetical protein
MITAATVAVAHNTVATVTEMITVVVIETNTNKEEETARDLVVGAPQEEKEEMVMGAMMVMMVVVAMEAASRLVYMGEVILTIKTLCERKVRITNSGVLA